VNVKGLGRHAKQFPSLSLITNLEDQVNFYLLSNNSKFTVRKILQIKTVAGLATGMTTSQSHGGCIDLQCVTNITGVTRTPLVQSMCAQLLSVTVCIRSV